MPFSSRNTRSSGTASAHKLIVGVDFGTTYSGVSYVTTNKTARDVVVIMNWPGPARPWATSPKTPSRIAYADENTEVNSNMVGFQVTAKMKSYTWFKLRLDRGATTVYDDPGLHLSEGEGVMKLPPMKNATQVCGEYLKELYDFTMALLDQRSDADVLRITPIEFWFTVPAIWSDAAKASTKRAAEFAGFGSRTGDQINFISEPEAAAIATLNSVTYGGSEMQISPGDGVLICDCGGGTVDITTYLVRAIQPLDFEELLIGEGGKCGSTYIDRLFLQWVTATFGAAFTSLPFEKRGPGSQFMNQFENHKRDFGLQHNSTAPFEVELVLEGVTSPHYNAEEGKIKFTSADLERWFRPVVQKILALLQEQMNQVQMQSGRSINKILLVGGFGDSRYLLESVRRWSRAHGGARVISPDDAQAAIVKGAAMRGLSGNTIKSRRCRRNYGFQLDLPYNASLDDPRHKYDNKFNGKPYSRGTMVWQIKRGQKIDENTFLCQTVRKPWYKHETRVFKLPFYSCNGDNPPRREEHPRVQKIGEVVVDLTHANLNKFKSRWKFREDHRIFNLEYELQIMLGQREGVLEVRAKNGNEMFGKAYIEYETE
ncbi:hypothetical protein BCR34DRAFT_603919 [Clohesyomyces aquaticus]|uniref:Actin-like ATPase domain-containing protein n=1 Tax=Clohesyomyces aquaticus TaxID=1231657 RepID=A0A1Y1ZBA8_9PLEO|nr:hypothetical protein BCR34DRAFT_603919 [Clohesyomyces aquaticus]